MTVGPGTAPLTGRCVKAPGLQDFCSQILCHAELRNVMGLMGSVNPEADKNVRAPEKRERRTPGSEDFLLDRSRQRTTLISVKAFSPLPFGSDLLTWIPVFIREQIGAPGEGTRPTTPTKNNVVNFSRQMTQWAAWLGTFFGLQAVLAADLPMANRLSTARPAATRDLTVETTPRAVTYTSPWLKLSFSRHTPAMTFLSVDATGESRHKQNLLKESIAWGPVVAIATNSSTATDLPCEVAVKGNVVRYWNIRLGDFETDSLAFTVEPKALKVKIEREIPQDYEAVIASPLRMMFDATVTPVSPLGRLSEPGKLRFPVLLHFPDWGSLLVRVKEQKADEATLDFSLLRDLKPIAPGAVAAWAGMTPEYRQRMEKAGNKRLLEDNAMHLGPEQIQLVLNKGRSAGRQRAGKQRLELSMAVTAIYPKPSVVDADPKLIGIKRAWLNVFGFRADLACLANNAAGDTCQFCLFCYADQACYTPPLFDNFTALDLVRISLDRYFDGFKGFQDQFQDVAPSTIIAAWDYATGKPDRQWLKRQISFIETYADRMIAADVDGDGLCESERDPTNWWDCTPWKLEGRLQFRPVLEGFSLLGGPGASPREPREAEAVSRSGRQDQSRLLLNLLQPRNRCPGGLAPERWKVRRLLLSLGQRHCHRLRLGGHNASQRHPRPTAGQDQSDGVQQFPARTSREPRTLCRQAPAEVSILRERRRDRQHGLPLHPGAILRWTQGGGGCHF